MNYVSAERADQHSAQNIQRPMHAGENPRYADNERQPQKPPAEFTIIEPNNKRQRKKEGHVPRREGRSGFADKRVETQKRERPRVVVEEPDPLGYKSAGDYRGDGEFREKEKCLAAGLFEKPEKYG